MSKIYTIHATGARYPARLRDRLGAAAPPEVTALGNLDLLPLPKTALFCSARCPGNIIVTTYDQTAKWRDAGRCVISGFHSPVEAECLRILLRGAQPLIIYPARNLPLRIAAEFRTLLTAGRLLILSSFSGGANRVTSELAFRRNEFVTALADEVFLANVAVGGHLDQILRHVHAWGIPLLALAPGREATS